MAVGFDESERAFAMHALGRHLLIECHDCENGILDDVNAIENAMNHAAEASGATVVRSVFHRFNPVGVSGVVVISESHLAVHTWPEYGYAAVDIFTCGEAVDPSVAELSLRKSLGAKKTLSQEILRGALLAGDGPLAHKIEIMQAPQPASAHIQGVA